MNDIIKKLRGIVRGKIADYICVIIFPTIFLVLCYYANKNINWLIAAVVCGLLSITVTIIKMKPLLLDYKLAKNGEYERIVGKVIFEHIGLDDGYYQYEYLLRDNESGEDYELKFAKEYKIKYEPEKDYVCYGLKHTKLAYCEELENTPKEKKNI